MAFSGASFAPTVFRGNDANRMIASKLSKTRPRADDQKARKYDAIVFLESRAGSETRAMSHWAARGTANDTHTFFEVKHGSRRGNGRQWRPFIRRPGH